MKKLLITIISFFAFIASAYANNFETLRSETFAINNGLASCTASLIGNTSDGNGLLLTAAHCFQDEKTKEFYVSKAAVLFQPVFKIHQYFQSNIHAYKVVAYNLKLDLALLETTDPLSNSNIMKVSCQAPVWGEQITALGDPLNDFYSLSTGIISSIERSSVTLQDDEHDNDLIQITAAIAPGSSGGPVVDSKGKLVGVADSFMTGFPDIAFAVSVTDVRLFLMEANINDGCQPSP